ncbi:MAG: BAX inhibitor (BI)-1/YccA family protein, partial [Spirochaetales bacterium]
MENQMQKISLEQASESARKKFMVGVYNWMLFGLLLSGVAAYFTATNLTMQQFIFGNQFTFLFLIIAELVLVFVLVGKIRTMSVSTAGICFVVY